MIRGTKHTEETSMRKIFNLKVGKVEAHRRGNILMIHDGKKGVVLTVRNLLRIARELE
jgi:hypothetical protein